MRRSITLAALAAVACAKSNTTTSSSSLADVCTVANVKAALPASGVLKDINPVLSSVTANAVNDGTIKGPGSDSSVTYDYCNVTMSYESTNGTVLVTYAFPDPAVFANRFYVAGGMGYSLNSANTGGLKYNAVSGASDGGYGSFDGKTLDSVVLSGNGTLNWDNIYMFGYQALGQMTQLGKAMTPAFYGLGTSTKIYTYYEGCSDGGREGMSQVQRYPEEYDGVITGAPAFRHAQQQVNHLSSSVAEVDMDYFPPPCEMEKIVNMTIAACDPLDGRTDGVVSRTDLCKLHFKLNSTIGTAYSCEASTGSALGFGFGDKRKRQMGAPVALPAQNGSITAEAAALAERLYDGIFNSKNERIYLPWQIASSFEDATTTYDESSEIWGVTIPSTGGVFVTKFIQEVDLDNLSSLDNVTFDTLQEWMTVGMAKFMDSLQTTYPDLSKFKAHGGKLLHYHGESDNSIPTASSVRYYDSVRKVMYPSKSYNESTASQQEWYKLFLIPGAAHCASNSLQPGPYPADNMATMIDWIESGMEPKGLNATVSSGTFAGEVQSLCAFPLRPKWTGDDAFICEYDQASIDTWSFTLDAFKDPVY